MNVSGVEEEVSPGASSCEVRSHVPSPGGPSHLPEYRVKSEERECRVQDAEYRVQIEECRRESEECLMFLFFWLKVAKGSERSKVMILSTGEVCLKLNAHLDMRSSVHNLNILHSGLIVMKLYLSQCCRSGSRSTMEIFPTQIQRL